MSEYELRVPVDRAPWAGMTKIERDFWGAVVAQRLLAKARELEYATVRVIPVTGVDVVRLLRVTENTERLVTTVVSSLSFSTPTPKEVL